MKRILFSLVAALSAVASNLHAQGTIQFLNSGLSPVMFNNGPGTVTHNAPIGVVVGVFWGRTPDALTLQTPTTSVRTIPGVFNGGVVYPLTGTQPGETVFLKIAGWYNQGGVTPEVISGPFFPLITHYGESAVVQTTALGPTGGPGTVIWQGVSGVHPNRAKPFVVTCCPEPSVWALGATGVGVLLLRRRRGW